MQVFTAIHTKKRCYKN